MATLAGGMRSTAADDRFHFNLMVAMALVLVAGFSFHLGMGRSSFAAPMLWHMHAFVFFGWAVLVVTQTWLGTRGAVAVHRQLGRLAMVWLLLMVVLGPAVSVATARRGTVPFFFLPQHFVIANTLGMIAVAGLVVAAARMRHRNDWHRRLQIVAFAGLLGPGFGRLLPSPLLMPLAFEASVVAGLLFPAYAMWREKRRDGHVHRAWWVGVGTIVGALLLGAAIGYSPIGGAIYAAAMAGSPGAAVSGLAYGPLPPGM